MRVGAHVFISGRVQGVFFRSVARREAQKRNVTGWVRNLPDGRVEAYFEGEKEKVREIIDFCRKGPPLAAVTGVEVYWEELGGLHERFEIK